MPRRACNLPNFTSKSSPVPRKKTSLPISFLPAKGQTILLSLTIQYPLIQLLFLLITYYSSALPGSSWAVHILLPSRSPELIIPLCCLTSHSIFLSCCSTSNHILSRTFLPGCCVSTVTCAVAIEGPQVLLYHILCRIQQAKGEEKAWFDTRMAEEEGVGV